MTPKPHYTEDRFTLYTGDATDILGQLPTGSAHYVVTSPPYWGLRDYGTGTWTGGNPNCAHSTGRGTDTPQPPQPDVRYPASAAHLRGDDPTSCGRCGATRQDRQLGLEPTPEDYVQNLRAVFAQLRRVVVPTGIVWLNLGDTYSANSDGYPTTHAGKPHQPAQRPHRRLPHKNLLGMPWRVALALQADGWIVRNAIVWHKPNAMPESVRDRLSCRHELLFLHVQQRHYHFDLDPIREPLARPDVTNVIGSPRKGATGCLGASRRRRGTSTYTPGYATSTASTRPPGAATSASGGRHGVAHPRGKNPGDVWSIPTRPLRAAHFAAFPLDLPLRCIAAGCPPGGTVLDPFSGTATTGLAARHLGRAYIGIDLNPTFHDIALTRLHHTDHGSRPDADATGGAAGPGQPHA